MPFLVKVSPRMLSRSVDFPEPTDPVTMVMPLPISRVMSFNTGFASTDHAILASLKVASKGPFSVMALVKVSSCFSRLMLPAFPQDPSEGKPPSFVACLEVPRNVSILSKQPKESRTEGTAWTNSNKGAVKREIKDKDVNAFDANSDWSFLTVAIMAYRANVAKGAISLGIFAKK